MNVIENGSVSRRLFLLGTGGALLVACGSSDEAAAPQASSGADPSETNTSTNGAGDGDDFALIRYFNDPSVTAGIDRRLALGVADIDGTLRPDGPEELRAELLDEQGQTIEETVGRRRTESVALPYYEFRLDVTDPAIYTLSIDLDGARRRRLIHGGRTRRVALRRTRRPSGTVRHTDDVGQSRCRADLHA